MAYDLDFEKSVGEKVLPKELIGLCYAYLYLTGDKSRVGKGVWYQGKKAYQNGGISHQSRGQVAAEELYRHAQAGEVVASGKSFEWGQRFAGVNTSSIQPYSFTGEGKKLLLGD